MKKAVGLILGLVPVSAFGECIPVPDCSSIGYTETTCDGDSIKCPFDTTKLYCPPCDSSFRYACSGNNIKKPIGTTCNNKYVACECIAGASFVNGECICDTSCNTIGNIYYSDGSCSSCNNTDKIAVGIIAYNKDNKHLIINLDHLSTTWSTDQTDTEGNILIAQMSDIPNLTNITAKNVAQEDFNGFDNTQIIVEYYGENAEGVAAVYCHNFAPTGLESSKGQWYLPGAGEVYHAIIENYIYINTALTRLGKQKLFGWYWSSTEGYYAGAWHGSTTSTTFYYNYNKGYNNTLSCFLQI